MTTAHRPTWKAAVGRAQEGGWDAGGSSSSRTATLDLASHKQLKIRKGTQVVNKALALQESLMKLEEAEKKAPKIGKRPINPAIEEEGRMKLLKQTAEVDEERIKSKYDDEDEDGGDDSDSDLDNNNGDDTDLDGSDDDSDDDDSEDDDDDEDDEAALQAELAKIRAEREEAKRKAEAEAAAEEEGKMEEAALIGNPLLGGGAAVAASSGKLKRRWNDDVVFRNQAKGEPEVKKRFINDTVRNDFHKRFLNKFIR